jgi:hypothetical protein
MGGAGEACGAGHEGVEEGVAGLQAGDRELIRIENIDVLRDLRSNNVVHTETV